MCVCVYIGVVYIKIATCIVIPIVDIIFFYVHPPKTTFCLRRNIEQKGEIYLLFDMFLRHKKSEQKEIQRGVWNLNCAILCLQTKEGKHIHMKASTMIQVWKKRMRARNFFFIQLYNMKEGKEKSILASTIENCFFFRATRNILGEWVFCRTYLE